MHSVKTTMAGLNRALTNAGRILHQGAAILLALMFALQFAGVVLRYAFALGWPWLQDLVIYLFAVSVLAPALVVVLEDASVRVDVFYNGFGARRKAIIDRVSLALLLLPAMAYGCWQSIGFAISSWQLLETSPTMGGMPGYYLLKTAVSIFFFVMATSALLLLLRKSPYDFDKEDP